MLLPQGPRAVRSTVLQLGVLSWVLAGGGIYTQGATSAEKDLPLPGEVFEVAERPAFLIRAPQPLHTTDRPWVWYAPTLPGLPGPEERWMFERFLQAGISIAGIDAGESYGSPAGNELYSAMYRHMVEQLNFTRRPVLLGRSRGGLMTLSWAAAHPACVGGWAGIYPVCDLTSYPGLEQAAPAYRLSPAELETRLRELNPVERLSSLAQARTPCFAIHGDQDALVPLGANSERARERLAAGGHRMRLRVEPGQGHNMWAGFFECQELVDFVVKHAQPGFTLLQPLDYQVIQRHGGPTEPIRVVGAWNWSGVPPTTWEYSLVPRGAPEEWHAWEVAWTEGAMFSGHIPAKPGGWYELKVRAAGNADERAQATVAHVGVGEILVVAGQSNSANHGAERQSPLSDRVVAFDGERWQVAQDPQPGASGDGGSFLPPLGDLLAAELRVPIGLVACGVGATSVREWLPPGETFPHPPTLEGNVFRRADGAWESKGELYRRLVERLRSLGPDGFRAVLWHQGESDANQADPSRTLPGELYRRHLELLIRRSRADIGWDAPWMVAQATYHVPGDEQSADIRAAQASLWTDGIAWRGPDSDSLTGAWRDNGGQGVHFSGPGLREHAKRWAQELMRIIPSSLPRD